MWNKNYLKGMHEGQPSRSKYERCLHNGSNTRKAGQQSRLSKGSICRLSKEGTTGQGIYVVGSNSNKEIAGNYQQQIGNSSLQITNRRLQNHRIDSDGRLDFQQEKWCKAKKEYTGSASDELQHTKQAVGFLVIKKKSKIGYDELTTKLCPVLGVQQHQRLCTLFKDDDDTGTVTPEVISKLKVFADNERGSYLLDDNSSIHFSTNDINKCFKEKDFVDIKPSGELLENPNFHFLLE